MSTAHDDDPSNRPDASRDGLFSDGFFGLLNKGPVGWIIFGLLAGVLYGAYQTAHEWLGRLDSEVPEVQQTESYVEPDQAYKDCFASCLKESPGSEFKCHDKCK